MKRLAPLALLLVAGCATASAGTPAAQPVPTVPPDLGGHQFDRPHADTVLVAGESTVVRTATGTARVKVNGPALKAVNGLGHRTLQRYDATFTVTVTGLTGALAVKPTDFALLAIADQVDGGGIVTTGAKAVTLVADTVTAGRTLVGTWTATFVEGHGELLYTPTGAARPAVLWDFRAEG